MKKIISVAAVILFAVISMQLCVSAEQLTTNTDNTIINVKNEDIENGYLVSNTKITVIPEKTTETDTKRDILSTTATQLVTPESEALLSVVSDNADGKTVILATDTDKKKSGWVKNDSGQWQYFDENGIMKTGWQNNLPYWQGAWFYFDDDTGIMKTGWQNNLSGWQGSWFYFDDSSGAMKTSWQNNLSDWQGSWFYFDDSSGEMKTGWQSDLSGWQGSWFYFDDNTGAMKTGWQNNLSGYCGTWFFFERSNGVMQTGWQNIDGVNYFFFSNGALFDRSSSAYIADVPMILQNPELPSGCEATSLTMLLNYLGYYATKEEIAGLYMPQSNDFYGEYGPDYRVEFAGTPFLNTGYGCFHDVIVRTAQNYFEANGISRCISDLSSNGIEQVYNQVNQGRPVIVWATEEMGEPSVKEGWYTKSGEYLNWIYGEHCLLLVGYNSDTVTINDPLVGVVNYNRALFEQRFAQLGYQAIAIY